MASVEVIEELFAKIRREISDKPEIKEWVETMRTYCRAYIKNEGIQFITPEDIAKHLLEQGGVIQFPDKAVLEAEVKLAEGLSQLMTNMSVCEDQEDE